MVSTIESEAGAVVGIGDGVGAVVETAVAVVCGVGVAALELTGSGVDGLLGSAGDDEPPEQPAAAIVARSAVELRAARSW